jgi:hypothetical protein
MWIVTWQALSVRPYGVEYMDLHPDNCRTRCPSDVRVTDHVKMVLNNYPMTSMGFVIRRLM